MVADGAATILGLHEVRAARRVVRTKAALAAKKSKGQRVGGIPYGYRLAADGTCVVRDAHEQNTIRRLRRLRRTRSLRELATYCDEHGIRARHSAWSAVTLSRLFRREAARTRR